MNGKQLVKVEPIIDAEFQEITEVENEKKSEDKKITGNIILILGSISGAVALTITLFSLIANDYYHKKEIYFLKETNQELFQILNQVCNETPTTKQSSGCQKFFNNREKYRPTEKAKQMQTKALNF